MATDNHAIPLAKMRLELVSARAASTMHAGRAGLRDARRDLLIIDAPDHQHQQRAQAVEPRGPGHFAFGPIRGASLFAEARGRQTALIDALVAQTKTLLHPANTRPATSSSSFRRSDFAIARHNGAVLVSTDSAKTSATPARTARDAYRRADHRSRASAALIVPALSGVRRWRTPARRRTSTSPDPAELRRTGSRAFASCAPKDGNRGRQDADPCQAAERDAEHEHHRFVRGSRRTCGARCGERGHEAIAQRSRGSSWR